MIYSFILSLVVFGVGAGLTFLGSLGFNVTDVNEDALKTQSFEYDMTNDLSIDEHYYIEYIESNINNVKVEYSLNKYCDINEFNDGTIYGFVECKNPMKIVRAVAKNLGEKKITNMSNTVESVKVYANKTNIEILKNNATRKEQERNELNDTINGYIEEINELQTENDSLRQKIDDLENQN